MPLFWIDDIFQDGAHGEESVPGAVVVEMLVPAALASDSPAVEHSQCPPVSPDLLQQRILSSSVHT